MSADPQASRGFWTEERRTRWVTALERATGGALTLLALLLIPILIVPAVFDLSVRQQELLDAADTFIWIAFTVDLAVKMAITPRRWEYARRHWFDVLIVVVPFFQPLRIARSARALEVLRLGRVGAALSRLGSERRDLLIRRVMHYAVLVSLALVAISGALVAFVERKDPEAPIQNLQDGIWWAVTTLTTVGYGDMVPVTQLGRMVGILLMLVGIAIFGTLTAQLSALLVGDRADESNDEAEQLLAEVNERLARLEALLAERVVGDEPPAAAPPSPTS